MLSRGYRGGTRTSNDIVGSLPVWVQLSSSRDCEANDGPFAAVSGLGVGTLCDGLRNLGCGVVNGDPVSSSDGTCGFASSSSRGWTVSHRPLLGAELIRTLSNEIFCSTDDDLYFATRAATIAFPKPI